MTLNVHENLVQEIRLFKRIAVFTNREFRSLFLDRAHLAQKIRPQVKARSSGCTGLQSANRRTSSIAARIIGSTYRLRYILQLRRCRLR